MTSRLHVKAVLQALFVTFLWSTSWVLIKIGLKASLPAITFAGLRYTLAFLCLAPFVLLNPVHRKALRGCPRPAWGQLAGLGLVYYTLTQGAQYVGLTFLSAATLTLFFNFTPVLVALLSSFLNKESPNLVQWAGIALSILGATVYFLPANALAGQLAGISIAIIGLLANAASSILGRRANAQGSLSPLLVTFVSMGIGGLLLLVIGAATQGFGPLDLTQWLIIAWLAVVNTALAFTLWNHTLRTLTAFESSIINNTMLPQIAILAWLFLGESLQPIQILALVLVAAGTLIVQLWRAPKTARVAAIEPD